MSDIVDEYLEGTRNFPKNKKITPASLCKFLGKDPSSLKRSRIEDYPDIKIIFDEIDRLQKLWIVNKKKENPIDKEKRLKVEYRDENDELKRLLSEAYAREVVLISCIHEHERASKSNENDNSLKLVKPRK